jgi:hypothetical protein
MIMNVGGLEGGGRGLIDSNDLTFAGWRHLRAQLMLYRMKNK